MCSDATASYPFDRSSMGSPMSPNRRAALKQPSRLVEWWTPSAIRRLGLESRGDREERLVRPDAGHELDGERQPIAVEAPRQGEGGRGGQVPVRGQARQADDVAMIVAEDRH